MEVEDEHSTLKRPRAPLSDTEDNVIPVRDANDDQKRRRLDVSEQENRSPQSSSGLLAEQKPKEDTVEYPSVRSRLEQLARKCIGGASLAQRCLSDPGADSPFNNNHGKEDFNERLQRFEATVLKTEACPTQGPVNAHNRSDFVSEIQQKLQDATTPSSKQASRIRQEREQELNQLPFQSIGENAWLKRSNSDPSLSLAHGNAKMIDGSFTESLRADKPVVDSAGEKDQCELEDSATPVESSHKVQLLLDWKDANQGRKDVDVESVTSNGQLQPSFLQPETSTVVQLSFSEDVNMSIQVASEEQRCLESTHPENTEVTDLGTFSKGKKISEEGHVRVADSSHGEDVFEPSTDDEMRTWRYPHQNCSVENDFIPVEEQDFNIMQRESVISRENGKRGIETSLVDHREPDDENGKHRHEMEMVKHNSEDHLASETISIEEKHKVDYEKDDYEDETTVFSLDNQAYIKNEKNAAETLKMTEGEPLRKGTFTLKPELTKSFSLSETSSLMESMGETSISDVELSSHDDTNTAEIIDQMFDEVLEYAERMKENHADEDTEDRDSGIGTFIGDKEKMETKEKDAKKLVAGDKEPNNGDIFESNTDELLTFPPSGILSPLSKSVEAAVTPLRLAASLNSNPSSLLLTLEETSTPMAESVQLYSVDAYRSQHQSKPVTTQRVTPCEPRATEKPKAQPSINNQEKITALKNEAARLQTVINQTLQALSCCTDEEHGRGSREEAEAEKLLLVSCEKRSALLAEVARLQDERNFLSVADGKVVSQSQPCRGTVNITNIQLPLKVEFVCSSHSHPGRPSHYFFILIRYGPCKIVATPLATAADAQNGDTISFPTSVTLKDIRSTFEIDVEVYSLSHNSASNCSIDRASIRSRVTPKKLLNTLTRSNNGMNTAGLSTLHTRRVSNFALVGSHKITLASLGHSKFPLNKMQLEGKIRRLLGDEFQEKVPFLSPLEGNIYLKLDGKGHSHVQHKGFLTMFQMISGFGMWHRRYFALDGCNMFYWNHPNDQGTKEPVGSIPLSTPTTECVRPVNRDSCARPFTFELVKNTTQHEQESITKCWFSNDTKQEQLDWLEKLNQALLDSHTWSCMSASQMESRQA